jgi:hypothetical protein
MVSSCDRAGLADSEGNVLTGFYGLSVTGGTVSSGCDFRSLDLGSSVKMSPSLGIPPFLSASF